MRKISYNLIRALTVAAAGLALLLGLATPAAATHPVVGTTFFADHTVNCVYMYTEGTIAWNPAHWGEVQRVDVTGVLAERPSPCLPDQGATFAELTAFIQREAVDRETVWLNDPSSTDAARRFELSLFNTTPLPDIPIDQVDVRVCRTAGPLLPAFTCGKTQTYHPPAFVPQP